LIVWLLAGILAWTGASCFAELGAAIPVNGGAQAYLNHSFGGWASYLFIWTNLVALKVRLSFFCFPLNVVMDICFYVLL
jgi:amino acid transporter